jgi:hypothetical protein
VSKETVFIAMENKGGGVILVIALLVGEIRSANKPESRYGLNDG